MLSSNIGLNFKAYIVLATMILFEIIFSFLLVLEIKKLLKIRNDKCLNKEDINMPGPEKFRESLEKFGVGHTLVSEINEGHEGLVSSSPKEHKAEYFSRAMQLFDEHLDFESKCEILDYNACCKGGARDKAAKDFAKKYKDMALPERIKKVCQVPNMGNPILNEDHTITTGIHWYVDGKFKCACPNFNKLRVG